MTQLELVYPIDWWIVRNCWGPVYHVQDDRGYALPRWSLWPLHRWPADDEDPHGQPSAFASPSEALAWCKGLGVARVSQTPEAITCGR